MNIVFIQQIKLVPTPVPYFLIYKNIQVTTAKSVIYYLMVFNDNVYDIFTNTDTNKGQVNFITFNIVIL